MSDTLRQNQIDAIKRLREYDHCFINADGVKCFTEPFGFEGSTYVAHNTLSPNNPKGLLLDAGLSELRGQDAAVVAEEIAKRVCGWQPWQQGRGSRLRSACEAVLKHLKA